MNCNHCSNFIPEGFMPGDRFSLRFKGGQTKDCLLSGINGKYRLIYLVNGGWPGSDVDIGTSCSLPLSKGQIDNLIGNATAWACISKTEDNWAIEGDNRIDSGKCFDCNKETRLTILFNNLKAQMEDAIKQVKD